MNRIHAGRAAAGITILYPLTLAGQRQAPRAPRSIEATKDFAVRHVTPQSACDSSLSLLPVPVRKSCVGAHSANP